MTALPILTAEEQRVLGCLLEKEITVPASYPLTLNALRTACNQSSSREPVVDYDERTVQDAVRSLKDRGLARITWLDYGKRTLKYSQSAVEALALPDDERALLTVLLLRGPQAPGELKARTDRLHRFADREAVEAVLQRMAQREEPLVRQLERKAGHQDHRWLHLLGDIPPDVGPEAAVDREQILAEGVDARDGAMVVAYEALADLEPDPMSPTAFEDWFIAHVAELSGPHQTADIGCGLGDTTLLLAEAGALPTGFDLAPRMIEVARERNLDVEFEVGDFRRLLRPGNDAGWGAILAWYSFIHLAPSELAAVLRRLAQTLLPDGVLALALYVGNAVEPVTRWDGEEVAVPLVLHDPAEIRRAVSAAGLESESYLVSGDGDRDRLYLIGRRRA
ncbi:DUF480 domain-containing protein [Tessaracoccus sp. MC1756]|uniref:DUF480 domain-containing protein n=1 Tax=Tessaracoccus sp. MC1756 TaxID=2760311 RepID=UPI001600FB9B|nr:DUF480 domain-containing protein [Tessaracoccus sp. MC1756]